MEKKTLKSWIRGAKGEWNRPEAVSVAVSGPAGGRCLLRAPVGPQKGQEGHCSARELLWSHDSKSWGITRAKPELPWLFNLLKDWYVNTQRSQVGWGSVRPLTSQPYDRNAFLHTTAAALRVQMWRGCWCWLNVFHWGNSFIANAHWWGKPP